MKKVCKNRSALKLPFLHILYYVFSTLSILSDPSLPPNQTRRRPSFTTLFAKRKRVVAPKEVRSYRLPSHTYAHHTRALTARPSSNADTTSRRRYRAVARELLAGSPAQPTNASFSLTAYIIPQNLQFVKYFSQNSVNIFRFSLCDRLNSKLVSPLTAVHCTVRTHRQLPLTT